MSYKMTTTTKLCATTARERKIHIYVDTHTRASLLADARRSLDKDRRWMDRRCWKTASSKYTFHR